MPYRGGLARWAVVLAAVVSTVIALQPAFGAASISSFESGFDGWTPDHFIECELDDSCARPFDWSITRSQEQARHGSYSLEGFLDGLNDDGTIWVEKRFLVSPGSEVSARITFWLWSLDRSDFNTWPVVAFVGSESPEIEEDFTIVGQTDQRAGWTRYSHRATVTAGPSGEVWVAFGFGATWESARTHYLDFVSVTVSGPGTGGAPNARKPSA